MKEDLGVQRVACHRILILWLVAKHAHLHALGVTAVERQLVMAPIATLTSNHIACHGDRRTIGNEVEGRASVVGTQIKRGQIAVAIDGDGRRNRGIKSRGRLSSESVSVLTRRYLC